MRILIQCRCIASAGRGVAAAIASITFIVWPITAQAAAPVREPFADAQVLESRDGTPDALGRFSQLKVVRSDFKYPLVRIETRFERDAKTGAERRLGDSEMVADHVVVRLQPGKGAPDLAGICAQLNGKVRKKMHTPGLYLVDIGAHDPDAVPNAIKTYGKEAGVVKHVEPDYIVRALGTVPNDCRFPEQWGIPKVDAPGGWTVARGNRDVVVGVIDTGIDLTHPDLIGWKRWMERDGIMEAAQIILFFPSPVRRASSCWHSAACGC